jgi:hypothetical protein
VNNGPRAKYQYPIIASAATPPGQLLLQSCNVPIALPATGACSLVQTCHSWNL